MYNEELGPSTDCCICLITRQIKRQERQVTQYLMVRNNRGLNAGLFNFPGGHIEENETIDEGNAREINEETGLEIKNIQTCGRFDISFGLPQKNSWPWEQPNRIRVFIFKTDTFSGKLRNPLLKSGQKFPEVKAFWCDEDKIPFEKMRDNDRIWFKMYKKTGYINNPVFIRENNKLIGMIPGTSVAKAKEYNEIQELNQGLIASQRRRAEVEGLR